MTPFRGFGLPYTKTLQVFIKSELKVGVIYVRESQFKEEEILDNCEHSTHFDDFLSILGEKVSPFHKFFQPPDLRVPRNCPHQIARPAH